MAQRPANKRKILNCMTVDSTLQKEDKLLEINQEN